MQQIHRHCQGILALGLLATVGCSQSEAPADQHLGESTAALNPTVDLPGWTARLGASGADQINSVAVDAQGNVVVGGFAATSLDSQTTAGGQDGLLARYSATGTKQWTRLAGTSQTDAINGVATDASGNIFVAGYLRAGLDGEANLGGQDLWLSRYDGSGTRLWTRTTGSTANDVANAVAVQSGGVYIAGFTGKSLAGSAAAGGNDIAVARYDDNGTLSWKKSFGTSQDDQAAGIVVDVSGNSYVVGWTSGALLGNTALGGKDILVVKLSPSGAVLWSKQLGTVDDDRGTGVVLGADGAIYVSGITAGALTGSSGGSTDALLVKLDAAGTQIWVRQLGGAALDEGLGVGADGDAVYLTGRTLGQLPGANSGGLLNIFAAKYALDGTVQTVREYSGGNATGTTFGAGVAAANGRLIVAGGTSATAFDGVNGFGNTDGVLMSLCSGHGFACELAGSCATNHGGCTATQTCTPDVTGFVLCGCDTGYTGNTTCREVNECLVNNGGCDPLTTCTNTTALRTCGACPTGYSGTGATGCIDINECATNNGGCPLGCFNSPGTFACGDCPTGFTNPNGTGCVDLDECLVNHGDCDALTTCTNTPGSRTCGACPSGYTGTGATGCVEVDECATNHGGCDALTTCTNSPGSFACGACPSGYSGTGATGCVDVNECTTSNGGCAAHLTCTNTPGARLCSCPAGLYDNGAACVVLKPAWTARAGATSTDQFNGVAVDSQGNVIVAGFAATAVDGQPTAGGQDGLLVKYSAAGTKQWTRLAGSNQADAINGVAVDPSDSIYVAGSLRAGLDGEANLGGQDLWLSKYDATGTRLWTRTAGSNTNDVANSVAARGGGIYIAGSTGKSLPGSTAAGLNDFAVARYDANGTSSWMKSFGSSQDDQASGIAVDASGNVYVAGWTSGALPGQTSLGGKDIVLAKLSSTGAILWSRQIGSADDDRGTGVTIGADDGIYVSGVTAGTMGASYGGSTDAVLVKFDAGGTQVWTRQLGGVALDEGLGVGAESAAVYLTGRSLGQLPGANAGGLVNIFAARYALDGTIDTVREYSGGNASGTSFGAGIAAANGRLIIAGGTTAAGFDGVNGFGNSDGVVMSVCTGHGFACGLAGSCSTSNGGCTKTQTCTPDIAGFVICGCGNGYTGSTSCSDVNECLVNNGACDALTSCTNANGSRTCGACPAHYTGTGATGCVDVDECATNNGGCANDALCTNLPGTSSCACKSGYSGNGYTCADVNECLTDNGDCDTLTTCTNVAGSRTCGACPSGYTGTGTTGCVDINECHTDNGGCDRLTTCTNDPGTYSCGECPPGYGGTGVLGCFNLDQCATNSCDPNATCSATETGPRCDCKEGYVGTGLSCIRRSQIVGSPFQHVVPKEELTFLDACWYDRDSNCIPLNRTGLELGSAFHVSAPGRIPGLRYYRAARMTGEVTGHLWDHQGALLASVHFTATTGGWHEAFFELPVSVEAGTDFVASFETTSPIIAVAHNVFDSAVTMGAISYPADSVEQENGLLSVQPAVFPDMGAGGSFFFVEAMFAPDGACDANNGGCDPNASCTPIGDLAQCACTAGFVGSGDVCAENQCLSDNGGCGAHATCTPASDGTPECTCSSGATSCSGVCIDPETDSNHCGACGNSCATGTQCADSLCVADPCLTDNGGCSGALSRCTSNAGRATCACATGAACDVATSVEFLIQSTHCSYSGSNSFLLYVGGRYVGSVAGDQSCSCTDHVAKVTITDPEALAALGPVGSCGDFVQVRDTDPARDTISFVHAKVTRIGSGVESICLADYSGGNCATDERNLCDGWRRYTWNDPGLAQISFPEDGNNDSIADCFQCGEGTTPQGPVCVDSCTINNGGCDGDATCGHGDANAVTCTCNAGFVGSGTACFIDQCFTDNGGCDSNATCSSDATGLAQCVCNAGFVGTGTSCVADPCDTDHGGCDTNATCTSDYFGHSLCACNTGYVGTGLSCAVDQCATNNGGCTAHATCTPDVAGNSQCACSGAWSQCGALCVNEAVDSNNCGGCGVVCGSGTQCAGGTCVADPCLVDNGGCSGTTPACTATGGVVQCVCPTGAPCDVVTSVKFFIQNTNCGGNTNTFTVHVGDSYSQVVPGVDSSCTCVTDVRTVVVTDAAALAQLGGPGACSNVLRVTDSDLTGGDLVSFIRADITRAGSGVETLCLVDNAWNGERCPRESRNLCDGYGGGSFAFMSPADRNGDSQPDCAQCAPGHETTGSVCLSACGTSNGGCDANATCSPAFDGAAVCSCNSGYVGSGTTCAADPCLVNNGGCDENAYCTGQLDGTALCTCNAAYAGDGHTCVVSPCYTDNGGCSDYAYCTTTAPSAEAVCTCAPGFAGDGTTCAVDQCLTNNGGCGAHATCSSTAEGLPQCACLSGAVECGGLCVAEATDSNNCGGCGVVCESGTVCGDGACVADPCAPDNGGCGASTPSCDSTGGVARCFCPPGAACDVATSVEFAIQTTDCSGLGSTLTLKVGNTVAGTLTGDATCSCTTAVKTVTITDPAVLAQLGARGTCADTVQVLDSSEGDLVSFIHVRVTRAGSGVENICVFDASGDCSNETRNLCSGSGSRASFSFPEDLDEDGLPDCAACYAGTVAVGQECRDPCDVDNGGCGEDAYCDADDETAVVTCTCSSGNVWDGTACVPNPCWTDNGGCSEYASCSPDTAATPQCACAVSYVGDGHTCYLNQCWIDNGGCPYWETCTPTGPGSVQCACAEGWYGTPGNCTYDQCAAIGPNGGCDANATCTTGPIDGSANCACNNGFEGNGQTCFKAAQVAVGPLQSLTPATAVVDSGMELGTVFSAKIPGRAVGLTYYRPVGMTGLVTGHLWDDEGTLVATVAFTGEAAGWHNAYFASAVGLEVGATYVASYETTSEVIAYSGGAFASERTTAALTYPADGVQQHNGVSANAAGAFPATGGNGMFFFIDALFVPDDICLTGGPDGAPCDDGLRCTVDDTCQAGVCGGRTLDCSYSCVGAECVTTGYAYVSGQDALVYGDETHGPSATLGTGQLTDGLQGGSSLNSSDAAHSMGFDWVGFSEPTQFVFSFPYQRQFSTVTLGFLADSGSSVNGPSRVDVEFSNDGVTWTGSNVDDDNPGTPRAFTLANQTLPALDNAARTDVTLKLTSRNFDVNFSGFTGSGRPTGRFVRLTVTPSTGVVAIDEVTFGEPPLKIAACNVSAGACNEQLGCVWTPLPNGTGCDDRSSCTADDTCQYGTCRGNDIAEELTRKSNSCTQASCDPETGEITLVEEDNDRPCEPLSYCINQVREENGRRVARDCTQEQWCSVPQWGYGRCQKGQCNPGFATPVEKSGACDPQYQTPPDQCHEEPACVANQGRHPNDCDYHAPKPDGTACNDTDPCTVHDSCQRTCYADGSCSDTSCEGTPLPAGTSCDFANLCVTGAVCQPITHYNSGGQFESAFCDWSNAVNVPVPPIPQCKHTGSNGQICDPSTGIWSGLENDEDGSECNAHGACSQFYFHDTCQSGTCVPGFANLGWNQCTELPVCNPETGEVSFPNKPEGTPCDDNNACTSGESCRQGQCSAYGKDVHRTWCSLSCAPITIENGDYTIYEDCSPAGYAYSAAPESSFPDAKHELGGDYSQTAPGQLIDGERGGDDVGPAWVGLGGTEPVVLTFKLQRPREFSDVTVGALADAAHGVAAPAAIQVAVSNDLAGLLIAPVVTYSVANGTLAEIAEGSRADLALDLAGLSGLYVRLTLTPGAGIMLLDEVRFGNPPSQVPMCHQNPYCETTTGQCIYPDSPTGASCNDGNACTRVDACAGGSCVGDEPVVCTALDQCHVIGACNPATGSCSQPASEDGTVCDDGDSCTGSNPNADPELNTNVVIDQCVAGVCLSGSTTICRNVDLQSIGEQCHASIECNSAEDGQCLPVPKTNYTPCDDQSEATSADICVAGSCAGGFSLCSGTPQTAGTVGSAGGTVAITQRFTFGRANDYMLDATFYAPWADGTSITIPQGMVAEGETMPITLSVVSRAFIYFPGWYLPPSAADWQFGTWFGPWENDPPTPNGMELIWWPVSFQPCTQDLGQEVEMTLRFNAQYEPISQRLRPYYPSIPGAMVNDFDPHNIVIVHYTSGEPEFILPDVVNLQTGILKFRGSSLGLYAPAFIHDPPTQPAICVTNYDCNDYSVATTDTCNAGTCSHTPSTTCHALDQCHAAGIVDSATGLCSDPPLTGTSCNDNEACTFEDTCQAGVCVGTEKTCVALDQCHVPGVCVPGGEGSCTDPVKPLGAACDDENACTTLDYCSEGSCLGGPSLVCQPLDQCHVAGICDPEEGCSNPSITDLTPCNDGNACTDTAVCQDGACIGTRLITCAASDSCHAGATCDARFGCLDPPLPNNTPCEDNNACTGTGKCTAGVCSNLPLKVCTGSDNCHVAGVCNPLNGECSNPNAADGVVCNDTNNCTVAGQCQGGTCTGLNEIACGFNPAEPTLAYAFSAAPSCYSNASASTCFTDPSHGAFSSYATGLLTNGARGGALGDGAWVGFPAGVSPTVTLRTAAVRPLTTLTMGLSNQTVGSLVTAQPQRVDVTFSVDGVTFGSPVSFTTAAGTLTAIPAGGRGDVILDLGGRVARFVRVSFSGLTTGAWTLLDELSLGGACEVGSCNQAAGVCSYVQSPNGTACGGPGDTCLAGVCSSCSAKGKIDCGGTCVSATDATGACLTPNVSACATAADCGQFAWLTTSCVSGQCRYDAVACDGPDGDSCTDGVKRPDGTCQDTGPGLLWDFEEGISLPTMLDDSGNGRYGVRSAAGVTATSSSIGPALMFSAGNQGYVSSTMKVGATDFTMSGWFSTSQANVGLFGMATQGTPSSTTALDREVFARNGRLSYNVTFASSEPACSSVNRVDDGVFHFAALSCTKAVGCSLYLDGAKICSSARWNDRSSLAAAAGAQQFVAGWSGTGGWFSGVLDKVAVFELGLSESQVARVKLGVSSPEQGNNRPRCGGVDYACTGASALNTACDDGDPCSYGERCVAGSCSPGIPLVCATPGSCQTAACSISTGSCAITNKANATTCDDEDANTTSDQCTNGVCGGTYTLPPVTGSGLGPFSLPDLLTRGPSAASNACDTAGMCGDTVQYKDRQGMIWLIQTVRDNNNTGFVGWRRIPGPNKCPNGNVCTTLNEACSGGGVCAGSWLPNQYVTSGPAIIYSQDPWANVLGSADYLGSLAGLHGFPFTSTAMTVNTGNPFALSTQITVPFPRERLTNGWNVDLPYVAAGVAPGSQIRYLNAPLNDDRTYIFGGVLAGFNVLPPGSANPISFGPSASIAMDPSDPAMFVSIDPAFFGGSTSWLNGSMGFSVHGLLRHKANIKLWNGMPLTPGASLTQQGELSADQWAANHFYRFGTIVSKSGNYYINMMTGTSGSTGPSGKLDLMNDGSTRWRYYAPGQPAWASTTAYQSGTIVNRGGRDYVAMVSGVTSTVGPTGTGLSQLDGTVRWRYLNSAPWDRQHTYALDEVVSLNGNYYRCVQAGFSYIVGPRKTVFDASELDGSVKWAYLGSSATKLSGLMSVINPANFYAQLKLPIDIGGLGMYVNGKFSIYFGDDYARNQFAPDWSKFAGNTPLTAFPANKNYSALMEGQLGLLFPLVGPLKISIPLFNAAAYLQVNGQNRWPNGDIQSHVTFRGRSQEVPLDKIPGMEWTKDLALGLDVAGYMGNLPTSCHGQLPCTDVPTDYVPRLQTGLVFEIDAPIPLPRLGVLPFRGTFHLTSSDGQNLNITLDARIHDGTIQLSPGIVVHLDDFAGTFSYDGEKFCAESYTAAGTRDVTTNSDGTVSQTTCELRLCLGAKDNFFKGSSLRCAPFCSADSDCNSGQACNYGTCMPPRPEGEACSQDSACQSSHCYLGLCKQCEPNEDQATQCLYSGDRPGDGKLKYCDALGFCQFRLARDSLSSCWNPSDREPHSDWCLQDYQTSSGQQVGKSFCDWTSPATGYCHECFSPSLQNAGRTFKDPYTGQTKTLTADGGGCSSTKYCDGVGRCQTKVAFGASCYSGALARGVDGWCGTPLGKTTGSCGGTPVSAWTCRQCGYDNNSLSNPNPACGTNEYCDLSNYTCKAKLDDGEYCGDLGSPTSDARCKSGACNGVCFDDFSVDVGASCKRAGFFIDEICKSGQCLASGLCGCKNNDTNCVDDAHPAGTLFCDGVLNTCRSKIANWEACGALGGHACVDGNCSVAGDALPGFCYKSSAQYYGWFCHANAECKSGNCRAGAADTCGCGGKDEQCPGGNFCAGDTCFAKKGVGEICNRGGECSNGNCTYFSPGINVCGCSGDEQCASTDYCASGVCRVRKTSGLSCSRSGECWKPDGVHPAACKTEQHSCNPHSCNCSTGCCWYDLACWSSDRCQWCSTCWDTCSNGSFCE